MQLEDYQKKREEVLKILDSLYLMAKDLALPHQAQQLRQQRQDLANEIFHLVVVGEFSRGKSTFVNALLGRRVLPANVKPTTAIISKIIYGETPTYTLYFKDGHAPQQLSEKEFLGVKAVPESGRLREKVLNNPIVKKLRHTREDGKETYDFNSIDYAQVAYPLSFCQDGVEVIDTPGTNDLNVGRIEITYNYLQHADAVILVLAADQPLSASEVAFLQDHILRNQIRDIFFVINFKDQLESKDQEERVVAYVRDHLHQVIPAFDGDDHVFLVSSRGALLYRRKEKGETLKPRVLAQLPANLEETGFIDLEKGLAHFLEQEKGQAKLQKYGHLAAGSITELAKNLQMQQDILSHSADEIRDKAEAMEPEFRRARFDAQKVMDELKRNLQQYQGDLASNCALWLNEVYNAGLQAIDGYTGAVTAKNLQHSVNLALTKAEKEFIQKLQTMMNEILMSQGKKAQEQLLKIWDSIEVQYYENTKALTVAQQNNLVLGKVSMGNVQSVQDTQEAREVIGFGLGSGAVGAGIAALITGAALGPIIAVGALAAVIFGVFEDKEAKRKEEAKKALAQSFNGRSLEIQKNVSDAYSREVEKLCTGILQRITDQLDEMQGQLQLVLQQKENKEYQADQEAAKLAEKQQVLHTLSQNLQAML